ncbi:hypothetical protein A1342_14090 [Methylomonas methanica]|uniref:Uncharacterized protein n=1 Tax=Methylomonas denitrificans TaxID=1538553 RepID=A0A126T252_9GAMM|nr:hypothetical protein JT25_006620 [Methylomonas denitrificans]OAH96050.1 hypothetical protein A1342_14090 [Methylomonas methanica]
MYQRTNQHLIRQALPNRLRLQPFKIAFQQPNADRFLFAYLVTGDLAIAAFFPIQVIDTDNRTAFDIIDNLIFFNHKFCRHVQPF